MGIICGIDEAGRGPVIGPLVMCGLCVEEKDEAKLKSLGAKDSKLLSPAQRNRLFKKITQIAKYKLIVIEPQEIDKAVKSKLSNLNWLEADKSVELINSLKPDKVYLDCPSQNKKKYTSYIRRGIKKEVEVVAEHHAEEKFAVVAAASIIAKVTRDKKIEDIKKRYNIQFGSGYPSDHVTVEFLKKNHANYPIFRKSWISYKEVAKQKHQRKLSDF